MAAITGEAVATVHTARRPQATVLSGDELSSDLGTRLLAEEEQVTLRGTWVDEEDNHGVLLIILESIKSYGRVELKGSPFLRVYIFFCLFDLHFESLSIDMVLVAAGYFCRLKIPTVQLISIAAKISS